MFITKCIEWNNGEHHIPRESSRDQSCYREQQKGSCQGLWDRLGWGTRLSSCRGSRRSWRHWRRTPTHSNQLLCRRQHPSFGNALDRQYPRSSEDKQVNTRDSLTEQWYRHTCIVTRRSSTITSLVKKSAPMVALYWLLNFLFTYWFMSEVFPVLKGVSWRAREKRKKKPHTHCHPKW